MPIDDGREVHETAAHREVGDIGAPDLIRSDDDGVPEQVGINLMFGMRLAGSWSGADPFEPHEPHQPSDPFAVHVVSLPTQPGRHPAAPVRGGAGILAVDELHDFKVLRRGRARVVEAGPVQIKEVTLPTDADRGVLGIDGGPLSLKRQRLIFFEPVELHLEPTDLLVEGGHQRLDIQRSAFALKDLRTPLQKLLLPLTDLDGGNLELAPTIEPGAYPLSGRRRPLCF